MDQNGMMGEAIDRLLSACHRLILCHRCAIRKKIGGNSTVVKIIPASMMPGVKPAPIRKRSEGDEAAGGSNNEVETAGPEKRVMAAIMLQHENTDDQSAGRDGQGQSDPGGDSQTDIHRHRTGDVEAECRYGLHQGGTEYRGLIWPQYAKLQVFRRQAPGGFVRRQTDS